MINYIKRTLPVLILVSCAAGLKAMTVVQPKTPSEVYVNDELGKIYDQLKTIKTKDAFSAAKDDLSLKLSNLRDDTKRNYANEENIKAFSDYEFDRQPYVSVKAHVTGENRPIPATPFSIDEIDRISGYLTRAMPMLFEYNDGRGINIFYEYSKDKNILPNTYAIIDWVHDNLVMPYAKKNMIPIMSPLFRMSEPTSQT